MPTPGGINGGERHGGVGIKSEGLKEGEQFVRGPVASWGGVWGSGPSKRAFFEGEVSVQVDLGCLDALVTKPERDHGAVHACLKQRHGGGVPADVRREALVAKRWAPLLGCGGVFEEKTLDCVAAKRAAFAGGKERVFRSAAALFQPHTECRNTLSGERRAAFLATLAMSTHMRTGAKLHVATAKTGQLGDA